VTSSIPPYLHLAVLLSRPDPTLRRQISERLEGKEPRFLQLTRVAPQGEPGLADELPGADLESLDPETGFRLRCRRDFPEDPPDDLWAAFRELLAEVSG
jgi:hypothetical protein